MSTNHMATSEKELELMLYQILEKIEGWVRFSEAKIIAFITIIGGSIVFLIDFMYGKNLPWIVSLYFCFYILFSVLAFIILIIALLPVRTLKCGKNVNFIHFADIIDMDISYSEYISFLKKLDAKNHIADQIIKLSYIADRKFFLFSLALVLYSFGVFILFGAFCAVKCFYRPTTKRREEND